MEIMSNKAKRSRFPDRTMKVELGLFLYTNGLADYKAPTEHQI